MNNKYNMTDFDKEMQKEIKGQPFADWFYFNKLNATNVNRISYDRDKKAQQDGHDVEIVTPKYGKVTIQEKFHPSGTYNDMFVEIVDISGTKDGWALKLNDVDFVIDFSKEKTHIVNAKKLKKIAEQIKKEWQADGGVFHNKPELTCNGYSFKKYINWTKRYGAKYWTMCARIPWDCMDKLGILTKTHHYGLSYPIK